MASRLGDLFNNVDEVLNNAKISNFEEVFSRTKTLTEEFSKKGAEKLELSRKKVECLDIKAKLSKAYEKFGRVQYNAFVGQEVEDEAVNAIADEIAILKERLSILTQELEESKTASVVTPDESEVSVEENKE